MPKLTDIATMIVGKTRVDNVQKSLYMYSRNTFERPQLSIKNKLKTQLHVGDEANLAKKKFLSESNGVFAGWCDNLNRKPKTDCFQLSPINTVKTSEVNEFTSLQREIKYNKWRKQVQEQMQKLGIKA